MRSARVELQAYRSQDRISPDVVIDQELERKGGLNHVNTIHSGNKTILSLTD